MKIFKKRKKVSIVMIILLTMLFQTLVPVMELVYAAPINGDLSVAVTNDPNGVLGKTKTVTAKLRNDSGAWIFNAGVKLKLDSGLEWAGGENPPNSVRLDGETQILYWQDIKDLAPNEEFSFAFEVKINETYRGRADLEGNEIDVSFGENVGGHITVDGSSDPQNFGGIEVPQEPFTFKVVPFEVILSGGGKLLKGAGGNAEAGDDKYQREMTIKIINNTKYPATIDLSNTIANGVQVTDLSQEASSKVLYNNDEGRSFLEWENIQLSANGSSEITYKAAIFDKYTVNGVVNTGDYIDDNTSLPITLNYSGTISLDETEYSGNTSRDLIAKDIILEKSINYTGQIESGNDFIYTLKARVNQYHDIGDIVLIDTLGDGQDYQGTYNNDLGYMIGEGNFDVTDYTIENLGQGITELKWTISNTEEDGQFKAGESYSLNFKAKVKENWDSVGQSIVAGDSLINNARISGKNMTSNVTSNSTDSDSVHTNIPLPTISKSLISINGIDYSGGSGRVKANIGDIIKFQVTYDASTIGVKQKGVEIVDIFPQGTKFLEGSIKYTEGDGNTGWDNGSHSNVTNDPNILRWEFGELPANTKLTIQYEAIVLNDSGNMNGKQTFNLAKMAVKNTANIIKSKRAEVGLEYTEPILAIEKTASETKDLKGGDVVTFTIKLTNTGLGAAYGVKISDSLPAELESAGLLTGQAGINMTSSGKELTFDLDNTIPAGESAEIKYKASVINSIGNSRKFSNTAKIKEYKNRDDGSPRVYNKDLEGYTPPSTSVDMEAAKATITMVVENPKTTYKVGDQVIYKVEVTIPANTIAYNGYVEVDIPNNASKENQKVIFVSTTDDNTSGNISYGTTELKQGYDIKWDSDNSASGTLTYYVKTIIEGPTLPNASEVQKGKAIFTWYDKSPGGTTHNTGKTPDVSVGVKLPQLNTSIWTNKENVVKDEEVEVTFTVENKGGNTAHNFIPSVVVPAGFTISDISDGGEYEGNASNGGTITFPLVPSLESGPSNKLTYTFKAKLTELQPAGTSKQFTGHSGTYYTNEGVVEPKLGSISATATVKIPSVAIVQEIISHTNNHLTNDYIRPGDTVDYKITVTVPQGTIAYNLEIEDRLPADFELVEGGADTWTLSSDKKKATISLGEVNASEEAKIISKIIKLKAKTDLPYGALKTETNKVQANWKNSVNGDLMPVTTDDISINVKEPNLTFTSISASKTQFNNDTKEITLTIPVKNDRDAPAYNGSFKLELPAEFEIADGTINLGGVYDGSIGKHEVTWNGIGIANQASENFVVKLKLKSDGTAGAGKIDIPVKFTIISYESKENSEPLPVKTYTSGLNTEIKLSTAPVTVSKTVKETTSIKDDYVRPGDTISYQVDIVVPEDTIAYDLSFKDVLGPEQELISIIDWNDEDVTTYDKDDDFYKLVDVKSGTNTILVTSKVKTHTSYNAIEYNYSNNADIKWKDSSDGTEKNATATASGTVKQPKVTLALAKDKDISSKDDISNITVRIENSGDTPAYNLKIGVEIPEGLDVVGESISNGGVLSGDGRKITWNNIEDGSIKPTFQVKQNKNSKANTELEIKGQLKRYRTKSTINDPDDSTKDDFNDGRVEPNDIIGDSKVKLIGSHILSPANPNEKNGKAEESLIFSHTLTNTGAGTDTYILEGSGEYPVKIKDTAGNILTEITLDAASSIDLEYEITIPKSVPKDEERTHTLTSTSKSKTDQSNSQNDKLTVVGIDYNGTTFDGITAPRDSTDWQKDWTKTTFAPGQLIELKSLTSHDITSVEAKIKLAGNGGGYIGGTDISPILLTKAEDGKWGEGYRLPDTLPTGEYFVEYISYNDKATTVVQDTDDEENDNTKDNNYFMVDTPELQITLTPSETSVVSDETVRFTLKVDNKNGKKDAYGVVPKVTLPQGVEFVSVTDSVYANYNSADRTIEFYFGDNIPYTLNTTDSGIVAEFTVRTNSDLSADEKLNFPASTGPYYTAIDGEGNPIGGTAQDKKETSALLETDTITFDKKILSTTNTGQDFVRPGDQIIYQIAVGIPTGLSIHNLNLEDIVGDSLEIEKLVVNGIEYPVNDTTWKSDLTGANIDLEILVYTKVKSGIDTNDFTTKSTANISWESKYDSFEGQDTKEISIAGKRPRVSLESFTSDKATITEPDEVLSFTGKIKNNGSSTAYKTKLVAKIPDGVVPVEASYGSGIYDKDTNTITWTNDLPTEEEKNITFKIKAHDNKALGSGSKVVFDLEEYFSTENQIYTTRYEGGEKDIEINATSGHAIENTYHKEVRAGSTVELVHILTNTGGSQDTFTIIVDSPLPVEFDSSTISLAPGQSKEIRITVEVPTTESKNKGDDKHIITLTAKGNNSDISHNVQDTIKIIGEDLDGWVSNTLWSKWDKDGYKDEWKEETYYLGSPLKLSAITSIDITNVKAEIHELDKSNNKVRMVKQLELKEYEVKLENIDREDEFGLDQFKLWDNTDYILEGLESGRYFVEFKAYKADLKIEGDITLTTESSELGYNNYFSVKSNINLKGTISDAKEKQPIEGAIVRLLDLKGNPVKDSNGEEYIATVGGDGKYYFPNVKINQYILEVKHNKYSEYKQNIYVGQDVNDGEVIIDVELIGFIIDLKANPSTIVGDGKSLTVLTTRVLDEDGNPIEGVEVVFNAPIGMLLGEPKDPKNPSKHDIKSPGIKGITNENGEAYMLYQSEKIEGIVSQIIPVTAEVNDPIKELYGKDSIYITFEPSAIKGIVRDNKTGKPIEGSKVLVTKTFDDGTTFYGEAITGPDGKYKIAIPKGDTTYNVEITKAIIVNGESVDISFNQNAKAEEISADKKDEEFPAIKTFTGIILINDKNGIEKIAGKDEKETAIKIKSLKSDGTIEDAVSVDSNTGVFSIEDLTIGKEYKFAIVTEVEGKELVMGQMAVTLGDDGEISIHEELIDPYGTIRDADTKEILGDVHVELFYADTPRNIAKGRLPNTSVVLPEIPGFAPNDNKNSQWSTSTLVYNGHKDVMDHGNYAWMVFSETDYYIVGTKSGYETYTSGMILVEFDVVKYDFEMKPIKLGGSGGGGFPGVITPPKETKPKEEPKTDNTPTKSIVDLSSDRRSYLEGTDMELEIEYINKKGNAKDAVLIVKLPKGVIVKNLNGGTLDGDTVKWKLGDLKQGELGVKKLSVELPKISTSEETISMKAELMINSNELEDTSNLKVTIFSNRFGNRKHSRYIQGYPDGEFKADKSITRAEIAVIFSRILRLEGLVKNNQIYNDVKLDSWYARGVEAATNRDLFKGYNDGNFRPNQPITRGELATVIGRFLELQDSPPVSQRFKDTTDHWALNYIGQLYRNNVITGYNDGTFKPQSQLKRSEAVTMINRMLNRGPLKGIEPSFPDVDKNHWANGDVEESTRSHEHYRNSDGSESHVKTVHEDLNF